jgi:hypothetical protein
MAVAVLTHKRHWVCPNCNREEITLPTVPNRYHLCTGLRGLFAPMVPKGTKAKVEVAEREDYVKDEEVATDGDGRPVMSIVTTRDNGQDVAVFAPAAKGKGES